MYDTNWNYTGFPGVITYDTREIIHSAKYNGNNYLAYLMQPTTPSSSLFVHYVLNEPSEWISTLKFYNGSTIFSPEKNTLLLSMYCLTSSVSLGQIKLVLGGGRLKKNFKKSKT